MKYPVIELLLDFWWKKYLWKLNSNFKKDFGRIMDTASARASLQCNVWILMKLSYVANDSFESLH